MVSGSAMGCPERRRLHAAPTTKVGISAGTWCPTNSVRRGWGRQGTSAAAGDRPRDDSRHCSTRPITTQRRGGRGGPSSRAIGIPVLLAGTSLWLIDPPHRAGIEAALDPRSVRLDKDSAIVEERSTHTRISVPKIERVDVRTAVGTDRQSSRVLQDLPREVGAARLATARVTGARYDDGRRSATRPFSRSPTQPRRFVVLALTWRLAVPPIERTPNKRRRARYRDRSSRARS